MRILFLPTNRFRVSVAQPMPIGLACVIGSIDASAHEIEVLDLMFEEDPDAALNASLERLRPEIVAISIRNIDNQARIDTQYFPPETRRLMELCREASDARIVVGGSAFTTVPEALFAYLEPDFGIAGDGEIAFPQLLDCLENGCDWKNTPGLVWREDAVVRSNAPAFVTQWNGIGLPRRDLFDLRAYAEIGGFSNIVISQGCPMRCLYCDDPHRLGRRRRAKPVSRVLDELEVMHEQSPETPLFFTAPLFNGPAKNAKAICRGILERGLAIRWTAMIHPAFFDEELAGLMKRAGCVVVSLACDTCSERMLENLRKDISKAQLEAAIALLEKYGIGYLLTMLFGGPGETRETIDETLDFLRDKKPLTVGFALGIRILPNTALAERARSEGLISPDDPLMEPKFFISPEVESWAPDYLRRVCAERDDWMFSFLEKTSPGAADEALARD